MRQGSVLAPSGTFGSLLRRLANKIRRTLILIARMHLITTEDQQENEDEFAWLEAYRAALLEFNQRRASLAIDEALRAIERRRRTLRFNPKNPHEWDLLEHATWTLLTIRTQRLLPSADNGQDITTPAARSAA